MSQLNLKKFNYIVCVLVGVSFSFESRIAIGAPTKSACSAEPLVSACENHPWDLTVRALYIEPSYGQDLGYSTLLYQDGVGTSIASVTPNWGLGFQMEVARHFEPSTDIDLNWSHYSQNTIAHYQEGTVFGVRGGGNFFAGTFVVEPKWDAVNLEFGKKTTFNTHKSMRAHVGVAFARVFTNIQTQPSVSIGETPLFTTYDSIAYNGFGPRFGIDLSYESDAGYSFFGKIASGLLIGAGHQNITGYTGAYSIFNMTYASSAMMVPEAEGKLGATYTYKVTKGTFVADVGYLWTHYFKVVLNNNVISATLGTNSEGASFDLNGVYGGLKWIPDL